jgi:zinc/manganese transport system permease protein
MMHFFELLGLPFLVCVAMTGILGYLGIHVLSREIVFVDIALAQIVAVGAIGAHVALGVEPGSLPTYGSSLGLALAAAAFYALVRRRVMEISQEAVIGVSYAVAAAAALFLIGVAPGGHVHTQDMLAGSILWATWADLLVCALVFAGVGGCFFVLRRPFHRISDDYERAVRDGVRVVAWDFLFYALLGVVITFAVRIGGVVVVFAFLIIPATLSALLTAHVGRRLLVAWGVGLLGALLGLLFAHRLDFSVGPAVALVLGVELVVAGLWRTRSRSVAGAVSGVVVIAYLALLLTASPHPARGSRSDPEASLPPPALAGPVPATPDPVAAIEPGAIQRTTSPAELASLLGQVPDPATGQQVVLRALALEPRCGVQLALRYLREDPPVFFRQGVVEGLGRLAGEPLGWDILQPFGAAVNTETAERLKERHRLEASTRACP